MIKKLILLTPLTLLSPNCYAEHVDNRFTYTTSDNWAGSVDFLIGDPENPKHNESFVSGGMLMAFAPKVDPMKFKLDGAIRQRYLQYNCTRSGTTNSSQLIGRFNMSIILDQQSKPPATLVRSYGPIEPGFPLSGTEPIGINYGSPYVTFKVDRAGGFGATDTPSFRCIFNVDDAAFLVQFKNNATNNSMPVGITVSPSSANVVTSTGAWEVPTSLTGVSVGGELIVESEKPVVVNFGGKDSGSGIRHTTSIRSGTTGFRGNMVVRGVSSTGGTESYTIRLTLIQS